MIISRAAIVRVNQKRGLSKVAYEDTPTAEQRAPATDGAGEAARRRLIFANHNAALHVYALITRRGDGIYGGDVRTFKDTAGCGRCLSRQGLNSAVTRGSDNEGSPREA